MSDHQHPLNEISISYLQLRKAIGILGIAFPIVLIIGSGIMGFCSPFQSSISCYYHTIMRNVFEGVLWIFAIFFLFYRYETADNIATTLAAICALGVALCPTHVTDCVTCNDSTYNDQIAGNFHNMFAISFFVILSLISLFLFTKTDPHKRPTKEKLKRNRVYRGCGIAMIACILLIAAYFLWLQKDFPDLEKIHPVFCLETLALWAFGVSWIVKGEIVLKDK